MLRLHQPPAKTNYAAGWMIGKTKDGSPQHFHNGSLVVYYALVLLYPEHDGAIVMATNIGMNVEPEFLAAAEAVYEQTIVGVKN